MEPTKAMMAPNIPIQRIVMSCLITILGICSTPSQTFEIADPQEFAKIVDTDVAILTTNATVNAWLEGPVWIPADGGYLLLSAMGAQNRVKKLVPPFDVTDFHVPPANTLYNGNVLDNQERLISAQAGGAGLRIVMTSLADKSVTVLASLSENDVRFYSPNDVVVKSDGTVWFTDPGFNGGIGTPKVPGFEDSYGVYRFDPDEGDGTAVRVWSYPNSSRPNGLCFSPDESVLWIADWAVNEIHEFNVRADNTIIRNRRGVTIRLPMGSPDGIRCDVDGRVWASGQGGIFIFTPQGNLIGKIGMGNNPMANLCFGGPDYKTLYVTGEPNVMSIPLKVAGTPAIKRIDHTFSEEGLELSWPAPSTGFILQETDQVIDPRSWTDSARATEISEGRKRVNVDPKTETSPRFFRMRLD